MKNRLIIICLGALCLMACKKEKESPIFTYTSIVDIDESNVMDGDANYRLQTIARSTTAAVRHIVISSYDAVYLEQIVLDTTFQDPLKEVDFYTLYHTQLYEDTTLVTFTTTAYATDGESMSLPLRVWVLPSEQRLRAIDDITLYSALSGRPSFFSFETMTVIQGDSTLEGLYFRDVAPKDSLDEMSYSWTSPNVYFARFESFDYGEATSSSIIAAYKNSKRDHTIQQLKANDVILVGTENKALGAMKIIYIDDQADTINDRYVFSLKALQSTK